MEESEIRANKLMMALVSFGLLVGCGSAMDYGYPADDPGPVGADYLYEGSAPPYSGPQQGVESGHRAGHHHGDGQSQSHDYYDGAWTYTYYYDWLSPGPTYYWWYPSTYYSWYYTPAYTYTYYPVYHYTTPVYYSPVVYYDWGIDPWWATNVYGMGGVSYYSSSWTYTSGFGFPDP